MKIRIINENDWEKTYEFDKSIIRVGSQISCDIQLRDSNIQPIHMQFNRGSGAEARYTLRLFADNVMITRGDQTFSGQQMIPYEVLDGDKVILGSFRLIVSLEDEKTRVRTSPHIEAEMFLQKREVSPESPINGVLKLKNTGTEKACQFKLHISGIPDECLRSGPLPYLYPGGVSTVGFTISHLMTKPDPGFHTVSISLAAPDEYYGEVLEFNQDIYVVPVFKNELILEDDSAELTGFNSGMAAEQTSESQPAADVPEPVRETSRMIPGQAVNEDTSAAKPDVPVIVSNPVNKDVFEGSESEEEETDNRRSRRKKQERFVVIRHDDESGKDAFDSADSGEESAESEPAPAVENPVPEPEASAETSAPDAAPAADVLPAQNASEAETETKAAVVQSGHADSHSEAEVQEQKADPAAEQPAVRRRRRKEPEKSAAHAEEEKNEPSEKHRSAVRRAVETEKPAADLTDAPETAERSVPMEDPADSNTAMQQTVHGSEAETPLLVLTADNAAENSDPAAVAPEEEPGAAVPESTAESADFSTASSTSVDASAASEQSASAAESDAELTAEDEPLPLNGDSGDVPEDVKELFEDISKEPGPVVSNDGMTVPVVYGSQSFDFADETDDAPSDSARNSEKVRFVKGGSFDA